MFYLLCCHDCARNRRAIGVSTRFLNLRSLPGLCNPGEVLAAISRLKVSRRNGLPSAPSLSPLKSKLLFRLFLIDFLSNLLQAENSSVLFRMLPSVTFQCS